MKPVSQSCIKQTTCPYCGVGCGVDVKITDDKLVSLNGSPQHPANYGKLCVKGTNLLKTLGHNNRLMQPQVNGIDTSWDNAITTVADKFQQVIAEHGADSVAFYVSGQLLTEDYYVANKLMKGFIGSANIDTNSRLCMSSAVAAYKRAFGEDIVPCSYQDLELSELIILVGSNAAWTHPVLYQRIERAKLINPLLKVVVIDPRKTDSTSLADLHLPLAYGSDGALFNGLLKYLADNNGLDHNFIAQSTNHFNHCLDELQQWTVAETAHYCDLGEDDIIAFYQLFLTSKSTVTLFSQGINQSSSGVDKGNAIINCHLATGKIGKQGSGPFSITGQPNAMGGREVGGLANMLAAHMDIENEQHRFAVQDFWQAPTICQSPGRKAVDLFSDIKQGKIKAVWIMATNPLVSMPNRKEIEAALNACELVVVSDCVADNDTLAFADVKFPATSWSEKDGTVTNSERVISRQRKLTAPLHNAKHDWQIISLVAKAMGFGKAFNYFTPAQIFDEHARLTAIQNNGSRALNLTGLVGLTAEQYQQLAPTQWPVTLDKQPSQAMFADGKFFTANQRANFIVTKVKTPVLSVNDNYPFSLTSGRLRDQWHTMTRTGSTSALTAHSNEALVTMHPKDADQLKLANKAMVCIENECGKVSLPVAIDVTVPEKSVFVPIHWSTTFASSATINSLFAGYVDPISGQPELKFSRVNIMPLAIAQFIYLYTVTPLTTAFLQSLSSQIHWVKYQAEQGICYVFRLEKSCEALVEQIKSAIEFSDSNNSSSLQWLAKTSSNQSRHVALADNQCHSLITVADKEMTINETWLSELLAKNSLTFADIHAVLQGQQPQDLGRKICSCFSVYEQTIIDAIQSEALTTVAMLSDKLGCGSNCGSCKTELATLIQQYGNVIPSVTVEDAAA